MQHLQTMRNYLMGMAYWSLVATALVLPLSVTLKSILFPATLILILLSCQTMARWQAVWRHPVTWAVASLVGLILLGLWWSDAPWLLQKKVLLKYLKLLYIPVLFLLAPTELWRRRVINAFLIGVTTIVVLGYIVAYLPVDFHRIQQADWIAHSYIEMGLMVAIAAYMYAWRAVKPSRYRILYWVLVVVLAYYQFFINTGLTGYLIFALLAGLFFLSQLHWRGGLLAVVIVMGLLSAGYQWSPTVKHKLQVTWHSLIQFQHDQHQTSIGFRLKFYQLSWQLWREKPWLGWGTGGFTDQYVQRGGISGWDGVLDQPHNEYLLWLVQYGVLGLLVFLWFWVTLWRVAWQCQDQRWLLCGILTAFMVTGLFNTFLYVSASGYLFVFLVGLFGSGRWNCDTERGRVCLGTLDKSNSSGGGANVSFE